MYSCNKLNIFAGNNYNRTWSLNENLWNFPKMGHVRWFMCIVETTVGVNFSLAKNSKVSYDVNCLNRSPFEVVTREKETLSV